jgi:hypothetical protein
VRPTIHIPEVLRIAAQGIPEDILAQGYDYLIDGNMVIGYRFRKFVLMAKKQSHWVTYIPKYLMDMCIVDNLWISLWFQDKQECYVFHPAAIVQDHRRIYDHGKELWAFTIELKRKVVKPRKVGVQVGWHWIDKNLIQHPNNR